MSSFENTKRDSSAVHRRATLKTNRQSDLAFYPTLRFAITKRNDFIYHLDVFPITFNVVIDMLFVDSAIEKTIHKDGNDQSEDPESIPGHVFQLGEDQQLRQYCVQTTVTVF